MTHMSPGLGYGVAPLIRYKHRQTHYTSTTQLRTNGSTIKLTQIAHHLYKCIFIFATIYYYKSDMKTEHKIINNFINENIFPS